MALFVFNQCSVSQTNGKTRQTETRNITMNVER